MNKVRSLKNIGWKHLAFTEAQLHSQSLVSNITNIQECFLPYIEEQQAIIDYEDYQLGDKIAAHKQIEEMKNWELSDIN